MSHCLSRVRWFSKTSMNEREKREGAALRRVRGRNRKPGGECKPELQEGRGLRSAYISSAREAGPHAHQVQDCQPRAAGFTPAPWRLHPCVHADPQEAELGAAQGCACAFDQWD